MPGAVITIDQSRPGPSTSPGSPGVARDDIWVGWEVQLLDGAGGNGQWDWSFLYVPAGSAVQFAGADGQGVAHTANTSFTPDLPGTYRIRLLTNSGGPGNLQICVLRVRYDINGDLVNDGWALPAFGEQDGESNYPGNLIAWAQVFEFIFADIRARLQLLESSADAQPDQLARVITLIGDSIVAGDGASSEAATGPREALCRTLSEAGVQFTLEGVKGWGAPSGTGTTWGNFPNIDDFHDAPKEVIPSFQHNGFHGRRLSATTLVTAVDTGTGVFSAAGTTVGDGSPVRLTSTGALPTLSVVQHIYFARDVVLGVSYKLAAFEGGPALTVSNAGSGTIVSNEGLTELVAGLFAAHEQEATDIVIGGGTNDISKLVDDGTPNPLVVLQARATAYWNAIDLSAPSDARRYAPSLLPITAPATNAVAKNELVDQYNAWLETAVPTRGGLWAFVDVQVSAAAMSADGYHPTIAGADAYGTAIGRAIVTRVGVTEGERVGIITRRPPRACVELRTRASDQIRIPVHASVNPESDDWFAFVWWHPFELFTGTNVILQNEQPYNEGLALAQSSDQLLLYWKTGAPVVPASDYTRVFRAHRWHLLGVMGSRSRGQAAVTCQGKLVQRVHVSSPGAITASTGWYLGAVGGLNGATGLFSEFVVGHAASLDIEQFVRWSRRLFDKGELPPSATNDYPLNDGGGTSLAGRVNGSASGILTGGFWTPAGNYRKPIDEGYVRPDWDVRPYTVTAATGIAIGELLRVNPTGGAFPVTLPSAIRLRGRRLAVKNVTASTNAITLTPAGAEKIDDGATYVMTVAREVVYLESDGANWLKV